MARVVCGWRILIVFFFRSFKAEYILAFLVADNKSTSTCLLRTIAKCFSLAFYGFTSYGSYF